MATDYVLQYSDGQTIGLLQPMHAAAREHLQLHVAPDAQWLGNGLAVEWRYIDELVEQLRADGFTVARE